MYKINAYITLSIPDNYYKGKPDEIASYIHKET
jgi:hypothetical protein